MSQRIINEVRLNPERPLREIASDLEVPLTTAYETLKRNKHRIRKTLILDFKKFGYLSRAFIFVKADSESKKALSDYLQRCNNVNSLFAIDFGFDYFAELVFQDQKEMLDFVENIKKYFKIKKLIVSTVISDIKIEKFLI
jgi:DNA-binding Lrp family transcriptional regulator